tara:strand:- start:1110 stop:1553 length:444 start_codon:yes stop_codon:yes gene_type:complete
MKKLLILGLSLMALSVNANTLDTLKNTPASKYEVGKMQLEIYALLLSEKIKGEDIKKSSFEVNNISVDERNNGLGVTVSFVGRTKDLTQESCSLLHKGTQKLFSKQKMVRDLWPSLSEPQYSDLESNFIVTTELVSKDNPTLKVSCE